MKEADKKRLIKILKDQTDKKSNMGYRDTIRAMQKRLRLYKRGK